MKSPIGTIASLYKPQKLSKTHKTTQGFSFRINGLALIIQKRAPESTPRNTSLVPPATAPYAPGQVPPSLITTSKPIAFAPKGVPGPKPTARFGKVAKGSHMVDGIKCYVSPSKELRSDQNTNARIARSEYWSTIISQALCGIACTVELVVTRKRRADIDYIRKACPRQPSGDCIYSHRSVMHLICWWW